MIVIIHLIITSVLTMICSYKDSKYIYMFNFVIAFCLPIVGYIIDIFIYLYKSKTKDIDVDDENDEYEHTLTFTYEKYDKEIIPLRDAILLSPNEIKKDQVKKVLESDIATDINSLRLALKDTDKDVSHYASIAIIDMKHTLDLKVQNLGKLYKNNSNSKDIIIKYYEVLKEYLNSGLLGDYYEKKYGYIYIEILDKLIKFNKRKEYYNEIIDYLLKFNNYEKVRYYIDEFLDEFECEESYMKKLKYCYLMKYTEEFRKTFSDLKESSIILSRQGLSILRFWNMEELEVYEA